MWVSRQQARRFFRRLSQVTAVVVGMVFGIGLAALMLESPETILGSGTAHSVTARVDPAMQFPPIMGFVLWVLFTVLAAAVALLLVRMVGWCAVAAIPRLPDVESDMRAPAPHTGEKKGH